MPKDTQEELTRLRIKKLKSVFVLTSSYLVVEVIGGLVTGSLALIADAGHMFTDAAGLALALFALNFGRKPLTATRTYGFYRTEILASLANGLALILLSTYILYEAYRRIIEPPEIQSLTMTIVAFVGLAVNFSGMMILKRGGRPGTSDHSHRGLFSHSHHHHSSQGEKQEEENLNMRGAYLEVLSDTLGSAGVIIAGIIIYVTGFRLADPIVSIGLALFIFPRTWSLMKKSVHVLMEGVPAHISLEEVKKEILQVKGVTGIFDLHIWSITSGIHALSAHVMIINSDKSQSVLQEINSLLEKRFRITHATIQIERYHGSSSGTI